MSLKSFISAYIECALWSSHDDSDPETGGEPLDRNYSREDLAPEALARIEEDCRDFYDANEPTWRDRYVYNGWDEDERAGHDFWLTRNHHGAGFWDRDWLQEPGENIGETLTQACRPYGEVYLYIGDDGKIYHD